MGEDKRTQMTGERVLYIDPWTGVSGDMLMAALLDTDRGGTHLSEVLRDSLSALGLDPAVVSVTSETDHGLSCTAVHVKEEDNAPLRHLEDLVTMLEKSGLSGAVKEKARAAFERLAQVEAAVHGCDIHHIHFHEVGALDTMVDVVGVLSLVEALGVTRVVVGPIPVGGGTVTIAHGEMRVPAPATAALLEGFPIVGGPEMKELTTPTGALLVGQLGSVSGPMPAMAVESVGYGCGTLRFEGRANVLRVVVGSAIDDDARKDAGSGEDTVVELETNIDDATAEVVGNACRLLREAGALEVWTVPAQMKKDRPGVVLHTLVSPAAAEEASELIIRETGSLGVRRCLKQRTVAERGSVEVEVAGVEVAVKWGRRGGKLISLSPEFDDAAAAAAVSGLALREVMYRAVEEARRLLRVEGDTWSGSGDD